MHDGIGALASPPDVLADRVLDLSIPELGQRLRDGRLTVVALVKATLARIRARDGKYRSFYKVLEDEALEAAARADAELAAGEDRGPLHGIPIGIKDLIDVAGVSTTANAPGRRDAIAERDAESVRRLRDAGAIIIGKLATYEWATVGPDSKGLFPPARNPWNLERITGGSSSGCAAAVAGGLLRATVGTDTGGSVRGPSFYCGTVGLKPTFGAVPTDGVLELSPSLDHVGPIGASVLDVALTFDVLAGRIGERSVIPGHHQRAEKVKIGYARDWFARDSQAMPEVIAAVDAAVSTLSQLGMVVEEVDLPDYAAVEVAVAAILHAESFRGHADALREHPEGYGRRAFLSLAAGLAVSEDELARARAEGQRFTGTVDDLLERFDVIVTAGALTTALPAAPFEKEAVWTPMRTIGFNLSGHPVLALPVGFHDGLPIGMQIVGRHHDEAGVLRVGHAFEQQSDVSLQRPPRPS
ncbi:amidase [Devosia sp. PTR5]|uniref:Indoleacetamide hydrolase n=2 Tax=Devosia oryzisoli TaxID=2774138 RepID=A0A927FTS3_9HYPH|nr:amidase [Devosia oryzisoli]